MVVTMTNPPVLLPPDPVSERPEADYAKEVFVNLAAVALLVSDAYLVLCRWAKETERKAREAHLRGERLAAYRTRHKWKAGDVRPLLSLGPNEVAQRRMAALNGKGRPVVRPHRPLDDLLHDKLTNWLNLLRDDATRLIWVCFGCVIPFTKWVQIQTRQNRTLVMPLYGFATLSLLQLASF